MRLIAELNEDINYLVEEHDGKKSLFIEGVFLQANTKNRNGRIYPMSILEREVSRYTSDLINNGRAMGELGHPQGPGINLDRVSHMVRECRRSGNDFVGKALILGTPMGKIAESLIQAGAKLGVSSRGMGSLKEDRSLKAMVVQEDFNLAVMIDIVADPSAPSAWVNGVMEGVDWVKNETGDWEQRQLEVVRDTIRKASRSQLTEAKATAFEGYVQAIMEGDMISQLVKSGVDKSVAETAVRRARVKARVTGQHTDARHVWGVARQMLGVGVKKRS